MLEIYSHTPTQLVAHTLFFKGAPLQLTSGTLWNKGPECRGHQGVWLTWGASFWRPSTAAGALKDTEFSLEGLGPP